MCCYGHDNVKAWLSMKCWSDLPPFYTCRPLDCFHLVREGKGSFIFVSYILILKKLISIFFVSLSKNILVNVQFKSPLYIYWLCLPTGLLCSSLYSFTLLRLSRFLILHKTQNSTLSVLVSDIRICFSVYTYLGKPQRKRSYFSSGPAPKAFPPPPSLVAIFFGDFYIALKCSYFLSS